MADGNIGGLKMSLELKDEVSKGLEKIQKEFDGTDDKARKVQAAVAGIKKALSDAGDTTALAASVKSLLALLDGSEKGAKNLNKALEKMTGAEAFGKVAKAAGEAGKEVNKMLESLLGGKAAGMSMEQIAKAAADYSAQLAGIETALRQARRESEKLGLKDDPAKGMLEAIRNAQTFLDLVQRIYLKQKEINQTGEKNPNVNTKELERANALLDKFWATLKDITEKGSGADGSLVMGNMPKALQATMREVQDIQKQFANDSPLSQFVNGAAKAEAALSNVQERLAKMRDLMEEGTKEGFKTGMLGDGIRELDGLVARLGNTLGNGKLLTDAAHMKNLLSDVTLEMTKARNAMSAYGREKGKDMAVQKAQNQALAERNRLERQMSGLYDTLSGRIGKAERVGMNGLGIGADTSALDRAIGEAAALRKKIEDANVATMGKGGREGYDWYEAQVRRVRTTLDEATQSQRSLNREKERADRADAAATRQRQREIETARGRIQSLSYALQKLWSERQKGRALDVDTSKADAKIKGLISEIRALQTDLKHLNGTDYKNYLGDVGQTGNGRSVKEANQIAAEQARVNAEKARSVELERRHQQEVARTAAKVRSDLVRAFEQARESAGKTSGAMQDMKNILMQGGMVYAAQQFVMSVIQTGGELERQHIALQSILGDMQNANTLYGQIQELALNSPFTFSELNKDVKQLAAYGVEYKDLYDTTKRLADMSSGLGVSFERIALAFGQVQARGWLDGKELRQIAYAGIPLLDKLSKYYSQREGRKVSTSEVKNRISARGVDFEDVKNIFWEMTDVGGQFYNMQQTLSETLLGRWNKLKDAWEIMLADFASGKSVIGGTLMVAINGVTALVQSLHTLAPLVTASMTGFALNKIGKVLGGGVGDAFLKNKGALAAEAQRKVMLGGELTAIERQILMTKGRITQEDLDQLAAARALTTTDIQRLRVSGKITAEQYKQAMAMVRQQQGTMLMSMQWKRMLVTMRGTNLSTLWQNLSTSATAAFGIIRAGAMSLGRTLWAAIGGLPGLLISAVGMGIMKLWSDYSELSQKIEQTSEELQSRVKSLGEFMRDNPIAPSINAGNAKEMNNLIDNYKEKLKEITGTDYEGIEIRVNGLKTEKEKLTYLEKEVALRKRAAELANAELNNRAIYRNLSEGLKEAKSAMDSYMNARTKALRYGATERDKTDFANSVRGLQPTVKYVSKYLSSVFKDIKTNPESLAAAKSMLESIMSELKFTEEQKNVFRANIMDFLGMTDTWLKSEVGSEMSGLIDKASATISAKIRNGQTLTEAEKAKVEELMKDAEKNLAAKYPDLSNRIKEMLAKDKFQLVIDIVANKKGGQDELEKEMMRSIPLLDKDYAKYSSKAETLSKGANGRISEAEKQSRSEIDAALTEWNARKKKKDSPKEYVDKAKKEYEEAMDYHERFFGFKYTGKDKGANKNKRESHEDKALKDLQQRLDDYKAARQMYQKLVRETGMGKAQARNEVVSLFPAMDWKRLSLDDYKGSIDKLMPGDGFWTTPERRKFRTQARRERAEWRISEELKPEFERVSANFKEALEKGVRQADLARELFEKTGDSSLAALAWNDGAVWDDHTRAMAEQYRTMTGRDVDLSLTDADAKKQLDGIPNAYELWQKITTLVKDKYVRSLQSAADIMAETATTAEKIAAINARYSEPIRNAESSGDRSLAERYRQARDKEIGQVRSEAFKGSADYLMFFEAINELGNDRAQDIAAQIRTQLNQALADGSIDAREYGKQIEQLEEQLAKLGKRRKSLWGDGFVGMAEQRIADGREKYNRGNIEVGEGEKKIREGKIAGNDDMVRAGEEQVAAGEAMQKAAATMMKAGLKIKEGWEKTVEAANKVDANIQGIVSAFNDVKDTMGALGIDTESNGWQDATAMMNSLSGMSTGVKNAISGFATGDIGGGIAGAISVVTSPIKAFAAAHDAKMDRQIKLAEREVTALERMRENVSTILDNTLGGVYSYTMDKDTRATLERVARSYDAGKTGLKGVLAQAMGKESGSQYSRDTYDAASKSLADPTNAFQAQYASLMAQRDELQRQRDAEDGKKKKDKDKLADYDQQIKELGTTIENFSKDFLKNIYGVDMKSWASQLTDAVVSAWEKGEDAMDAYRKKAKELVKDLTKNIVSQKIMEKAMEAPLKLLTSELEKNGGKLNEDVIPRLVNEITSAGEDATNNITKLYDALKAQGYDFTEAGSGSVSSSIKSGTEETADILASYLNAVRLDVSVNRANVKAIGDLLQEQMPEMGQIQKAQLGQLTQLVVLAEARNEKLDRITDWMTAVTTSGRRRIYVN